MAGTDLFGTRAELVPGVSYHRLGALAERGIGDVSRLPVTLKILLENSVRNAAAPSVREGDVEAIASWDGTGAGTDRERAFMPARVLLQDFTGVPAVVDLAAMRSAVARERRRPDAHRPAGAGRSRRSITPCRSTPSATARRTNATSRASTSATASGTHCCAGRSRRSRGSGSSRRAWASCTRSTSSTWPRWCRSARSTACAMALPDTLVGTDSHTPMVNGVGVLGWGVGGIEAEACMLGQPLFLLAPVVVGVRFHNALPAGTTATDLVLTLTELLRKHGVVNKFVEFCGSGLTSMSVPDRATLSNMSPEFGATASLFPVDARTLEYLLGSGRDPSTSTWWSAMRRNRACSAQTTRTSRRSARWSSLIWRASCRASQAPSDRRTGSRSRRVWESFTNVWEQRADRRRGRGHGRG